MLESDPLMHAAGLPQLNENTLWERSRCRLRTIVNCRVAVEDWGLASVPERLRLHVGATRRIEFMDKDVGGWRYGVF